jgi:hyperosmotically inducible protein
MTGQTAGQYVDDTTITASVKAKLVGDKTANLTRIEVDTTNQVVTLNGIVESADQKARAEQPARQVGGEECQEQSSSAETIITSRK